MIRIRTDELMIHSAIPLLLLLAEHGVKLVDLFVAELPRVHHGAHQGQGASAVDPVEEGAGLPPDGLFPRKKGIEELGPLPLFHPEQPLFLHAQHRSLRRGDGKPGALHIALSQLGQGQGGLLPQALIDLPFAVGQFIFLHKAAQPYNVVFL